MSSFWYYGCIPAVGGSVLILGGALALWVDRRDVLLSSASSVTRPVYLRYVSQATYDLQKRPHWILIIATALFAPFMTVTAVWQSQLAADDLDNDGLARDLKLFGYSVAASLVLVAASPMGNKIGTVLHTLLAGCVVAFGLNYCILANDRGDNALSIVRQVAWIFGAVGAILVMFTTYPAVLSTEKLTRHERATHLHLENTNRSPEEVEASENSNSDNVIDTTAANANLTPKQIQTCRLLESTLAFAQMSQALMIGVVLLSAAAEVGSVNETNATNEAMVVGLVSAAASMTTTMLFALLNATFVQTCQGQPSNENDNNIIEEA